MFIRISFVRSAGFIASGFLTVALLAQSAFAQTNEPIKTKVVDDAANQMVASIQNDSCPQFQAMLQQHKGGGSNSKRSSGMLKQDPALRARFVDKVAGPLVNKMIDCDMLPGK